MYFLQIERKPKHIDTIRNKRKCYRMKKKELIRLQKTGVIVASPGNDCGYSASPRDDITCLPSHIQADCTSPSLSSARADSPPPSQAGSIFPALSTASTDSLPRNHDWDILYTEAAQMRAVLAEKDAELRNKYAAYVDSSPVFPFSNRQVNIPKGVTGIDRVLLETEMKTLIYSETKAIEQARLYCNKCDELRQECNKLESENEAVRYCWRNKLIEGRSRSAVMLRKSLHN